MTDSIVWYQTLVPRLVPWDAVATGFAIAAVIVGLAFFLRRRRFVSLALITVAPVAGWFSAIWRFQGIPGLPPHDAPLWAFYLALGGVFLCGYGIWRPYCLGCVGMFARMLYLPALWILIFHPVFHYQASTLGWKILAFGLTGTGIIAIWHRRAGLWPTAEYVPWLIALTGAAICLSLTGAPSVGMMTLTLCFAAIPSALCLMVSGAGAPPTSTKNKSEWCIDTDGIIESAETSKPPLKSGRKPSVPQGFTLPLAFALPALVCSGPLYASTPWGIACLVLAAPVTGFAALRIFEMTFRSRLKKCDRHGGNLLYEFAAIAIALTASAIPAGIAAYLVMSDTAAAGAYF